MTLTIMEKPILLAGIEQIPNRLENGIYFGLPEEQYHAHFALSATGIKHLRESTLSFWARSSLNPNTEDEDTEAKTLGRAYDKRIVEGRDAFYSSYAPDWEAPEGVKMLTTSEDLSTELKLRDLPCTGSKTKLIERLLNDEPIIRGRITELCKESYAQRNEGKELLPRKFIDRIEIAAKMIEGHPQLKKAFTGGYPQVSIFWTDEESGVPCKARLDYLKPAAIVDLKSVGNEQGMPLDQAVARQVANYKYHIQAALYLEAADAARFHIERGLIFGEAEPSFLERLVATKERTFLFVFQFKGIAPVALGKVLPSGMTLDLGRYEIDNAKAAFKRCWETFGTDPWLEIREITTFDSTEFPQWISN